jgi:hypothetical protein
MGLNLCWIAVQHGQQAAILDRLGFEAIGETGDEIGVDYACAVLANGWFVFVTMDRSFLKDRLLAKVSSDGLWLGCEMSETVMFSRARAFQDGTLLWSVFHDPDQDRRGVLVEGVPPPEFRDIRQRLAAEQAMANDDTVDLMFDLPMELAASVCGYRAGETRGVEWTVLRKKAAGRTRASSRPANSLPAAMRRELLPLLRGLGWSLAHDPPSLSDPGEIVRELDDRKQTLWFDFGSGKETYIIVHFNSLEITSAGSRYSISGRTRDPPLRLPLWKRFTWRTLRTLTKPEPVVEDIIGAVIAKAKTEILAVDRFLKTDELSPCIYVKFAGPVERTA